jgi:hypothetical protein
MPSGEFLAVRDSLERLILRLRLILDWIIL